MAISTPSSSVEMVAIGNPIKAPINMAMVEVPLTMKKAITMPSAACQEKKGANRAISDTPATTETAAGVRS